MLSSARWRHPLALTLLVGSVFLAVPPSARARTRVVAIHGTPSSISANYGEAVPIGDSSTAGPYLIPTGAGIEIRDAMLGGDAPIGTFRTPGEITGATVDGTTAYLFAGDRGIVAVDISSPGQPAAIGSRGDLGTVSLGAASPNGYGLAAISDAGLLFLGRSAPGQIFLASTLRFEDERMLVAVRARADSFLVVSSRTFPAQRLLLTLYRLPVGASEAESLSEVAVPLEIPTSMAWRGDLAFVGAGNGGIVVVNIRTGAHHSYRLPGNAYVRAVDANDSVVVAVTPASGFARVRRAGALGDTLVNATLEALSLDPFHVTLSGDRVLLATRDAEAPQEPDEVGRSAIEFRDLDGPTPFPPAGGTGRTRRVVQVAGYAYVADYTGGLRIYRAGGTDTSLVGVLPPPPSGRAVDLAVDAAHGRAYLALSSAGLEVVDISDPASPVALATLLLSEQVSAVAVADSTLLVVGRRGTSSAGITLVDVTVPTSPTPRGTLGQSYLPDPRAIAVKDTVAFVADASVGLTAVGFGNPDAPAVIGLSTGAPATDVDLAGNRLLVGTLSRGLQVVDVFNPAVPFLRSEFALPPVRGVAQSGNSAVVFLDGEEVSVIDLTDPFAPTLRGPIAVPGNARDGSWVGDTLLVAAGLALDRFQVSPAISAAPPLTLAFDNELLRARIHISWSPVSLPGLAGLNVFRDVVAGSGVTDPTGVRVNGPLLDPAATDTFDPDVPAGATLHYRLEAFFVDGSIRTVAEGSIFIPSTPGLGRPYPNPYRPGTGALTIPFRIISNPSDEEVELGIYDVSGRLVRKLVQAPPPGGGFGSIAWDGRDAHGQRAPDGVYFLRLRAGGVDDSRQIVLLR
jgi:hypothetical protein